MVLARALAHSSLVSLPPDEAHNIPWVGTAPPLLYMASPFRYSSALAAHHLRLLPPLLEELIEYYNSLNNGASLVACAYRARCSKPTARREHLSHARDWR